MAPDKAVFTAMTVTLVSTTAASMLPEDKGGHGELPPVKQLIGTSLTFMGLSILADIAPRLGVSLAAAIAVTAVTFYGVPIADTYFTTDKPARPRPRGGRPSTGAAGYPYGPGAGQVH